MPALTYFVIIGALTLKAAAMARRVGFMDCPKRLTINFPKETLKYLPISST
jgi:hypothetical protein